jgi:hypothetical protein
MASLPKILLISSIGIWMNTPLLLFITELGYIRPEGYVLYQFFAISISLICAVVLLLPSEIAVPTIDPKQPLRLLIKKFHALTGKNDPSTEQS